MANPDELDEINEMLLEEDEDTQKDKYLTFHIDNEEHAIEIKYVNEIISIQKITAVPNVKKFIKGIINLRGNIIPVVGVRKRFNLEEIDFDEKTCIIVTNHNENAVGLIVDEVAEVLSIPEDAVAPAPQTKKGSHSRFIQGIGKVGDEVKIILNIEKLLYDTDEKKVDID